MNKNGSYLIINRSRLNFWELRSNLISYYEGFF